MSSSSCCFLTCIQISQEAGQVVWYSHLFKNFPQFVVIHPKALVQSIKQKLMFFCNSCFFDDPMDVGDLISGSSAFSKSRLNIWNFTVHILVKPGLENLEHHFTSVWDSLVAQTVKCLLPCSRPRFDPWVGKIPWRRKWQPTAVLLPWEFHGWRSLVGYSWWGRKESDTTERLNFTRVWHECYCAVVWAFLGITFL